MTATLPRTRRGNATAEPKPPQPGCAHHRHADEAVMALAARQYGIVTRRQLLRAGVAPDVVDRRLKAGELRALHRGVYRVGPLVAARAKELAAALACGPSAVVSHRSAASLWKMLPGRAAPDPAEVIFPKGKRRQPGIRIHCIATLRPDEATRLDGIPITTPARTLYDLASTVLRGELEAALAESLALHMVNRSQLIALLARRDGRPGASRLRALLEPDARPARTRSEAEATFIALVAKAQLRKPVVNMRVCGYEVDCFWPEERVVVEIDGYAFHSSKRRFEGDRRRDNVLAAGGMHVIRVTWQQIENEPEAMLVRLGQVLARASRSS